MNENRTRKHRKKDYHKLLGTIRANTGHPQPVMIDAMTLWTTLVGNGSVGHEFAQSALRAAKENGHVIRWTDGDGTVKYGLTTEGLSAVSGSNPYGPEDIERFRGCIEIEASREHSDTSFIAWCNQRIAEVQE